MKCCALYADMCYILYTVQNDLRAGNRPQTEMGGWLQSTIVFLFLTPLFPMSSSLCLHCVLVSCYLLCSVRSGKT